ncbi:hypothetical protein F7725_007308 [Dissostichus mawsoni]|uniref:Uncharacterized protein n=1 Tax=Dissostichus mawsoni TaxID=36200 RepID=A0A7J5XWF5_DISMA|nr:hypothetical protein F7725_007308 [Dissostichus mawsoni]
MSTSYVHQRWLEVQKEMFSGPPRELQRLSDTRWACRYIACRNLMDRLTAVIRVLEEISDEPNPTRAVEARGLLCQIDIKFIALLTVFRKVLGDTKLLSDMLQSSKIDLCKAIDLIETLRQTLEEYRNEGETFNELWNTVIETCDNCNISKVIKQKRATQTASRLDDGVVTSTLGQRTQVDSKEAFRVNIFLPIINSMIGEMEKHFSKSNCSIMEALNPSSSNFLKEEMVLLFAEAYGSDLPDLKNEINQARRLFERNRAKGKETPTTLMDLVKFLDPFKDVLFELFRLCKIATVLPELRFSDFTAPESIAV